MTLVPSEKIILESLNLGHAQAFLDGLQRTTSPYNSDAKRHFTGVGTVESMILSLPLAEVARYAIMVARPPELRRFAGCISLASSSGDRLGKGRVGDIGYWLDPEYTGRGIMTESVRALARYALKRAQPPYEWLEAHTDVDNIDSQLVLARAGFTWAGVAYDPDSGMPDAFRFVLYPTD